jgi:hypothetical protein|tara:strand:+ start:131 stop:631 length:501 start_codon:yes stop_codon:yes gene_type:complete
MRLLLVLVYIILLTGCEDLNTDNNSVYKFTLNPRLEIDNNGYYHLDVIRQNRQTLHRINGVITKDDILVENVFFEWSSNLYWILGDTLGYIINQNLNDEGKYVSTDSSYITGFKGFEVQTINCCSYSNGKGEVNTMIGLVKQMIGDTMIVNVSYLNKTESIGIVLK